MSSKTSQPLPIPSQQYDSQNEYVTRRTIEQSVQDLNNDVGLLNELSDTIVSKAIRRHQFLLMGAKGYV